MGPLALIPATERSDTWKVEFTWEEKLELEIVRRNLDDLVVARSMYGWSDLDRDRYVQLCRSERSLLGPLVSH